MIVRGISIRLAPVLAFCLLLWQVVSSFGDEDFALGGRSSLKGLEGVVVEVGTTDLSREVNGVPTSELKTILELELRRHSVPVLSPPASSSAGVLVLYVFKGEVIEAAGLKTQPVCYQLRLFQKVTLLRDPQTELHCPTWAGRFAAVTGLLGISAPVLPPDVAQGLRNTREQTKQNVRSMAREFANQWLAANGSSGKPPDPQGASASKKRAP